MGEFLSDNPRFISSIILPFPVIQTSVKVVGILEKNIYLQSFAGSLPFSLPPSFSLLPPQSNIVNMSLAIFIGKFSNVDSVGSLWLNSSTHVEKSPIVRFNYYSHPDDLARCVRGVRKVGDLLKTPTMEKIKMQDLEGKKGFQFLGAPLPENLRVVDGSTFSVSPGTNPMATLMMLCRYVGLKVLQQRST